MAITTRAPATHICIYLDPDIVEMFGDIAHEYVRRFRKMVPNAFYYLL